jgi:hypothetical protein
LLEAAEGWSFSVRDGAIAGKRGKRPGVLRLVTVASNEVPNPVTHEVCLRIAAERLDIRAEKPTDVQMFESATGPVGSACYTTIKDVVCVWYCTRPAGLILGALACRAALAKSPDFRFTRAQCSRMIGSALFNRAEWGGDDPLTQIVLTEMLQVPQEDDPGRRVAPRPADEPTSGTPPKSDGTGSRRR